MLADMELAIKRVKERAKIAMDKCDEVALEIAKARQALKDVEVLAARADGQSPDPSKAEVQAALGGELAAVQAAMRGARDQLDVMRTNAQRVLKA